MSEQEPPDVASRVRVLREERGLSMRGLAERCGVSPNTISLIERGVTSPNISTLHQLALALQVPITAFFDPPSAGVQVIVSHPGARASSGSSSVLLESLGSGLQGQMLQPFVVTLSPASDSGPGTMSHDGHELVFCLQGELEYRIDGQEYRLATNGSLLFEASLPHCWRNPGDEPSVFLLIFQTDEPGKPVEQHLHP